MKHFCYSLYFLNKNNFTFFFYAITLSILLYPYLEKSIIYFFFYYSSPKRVPICFFKIYIVFRDPELGKLIALILSSPLLIKIGLVWSVWLAVLFFLSAWNFYWKYALNCAPTCIFLVEQKYNAALLWCAKYLSDLANHFLLSVSYF